ncbi:hypothetical protein [Tolypothrix sp. VBCCA 56010]
MGTAIKPNYVNKDELGQNSLPSAGLPQAGLPYPNDKFSHSPTY